MTAQTIKVHRIKAIRVEGEWIAVHKAQLVPHFHLWDGDTQSGASDEFVLVFSSGENWNERTAVLVDRIQAYRFTEERE
jgi:hypothetical protein